MKNREKERRNFFRHPLGVPIQLRIASSDPPYFSRSSDISLGGLNFTWSKKLAKGTMIALRIPVKEKLFDIKAKVVFCKEERGSAHYRTGVSFVDSPSAFKAKLAEEVLQILEYRKSISRQLGYEISEEMAAKKWINQFATTFSDFPSSARLPVKSKSGRS